jgi:hypothetical protein
MNDIRAKWSMNQDSPEFSALPANPAVALYIRPPSMPNSFTPAHAAW